MNDEQKESRFAIDGTDYPVPTLDSLDTDEMQLLYDMSGLGVEDFVFADDDQEAAAELERKLRNPGFIRALMQITYQRGNPSITPARARAVIGKSNMIDAYSNWLESMVDLSPPEPTRSELEQQDSLQNSGSSAESSGTDSTNGSGEPDKIPESTGTTRSDTSSPASLPTT